MHALSIEGTVPKKWCMHAEHLQCGGECVIESFSCMHAFIHFSLVTIGWTNAWGCTLPLEHIRFTVLSLPKRCTTWGVYFNCVLFIPCSYIIESEHFSVVLDIRSFKASYIVICFFQAIESYVIDSYRFRLLYWIVFKYMCL